MKIKKETLQATLGGLSVMLSAFLLLVVVSDFGTVAEGAKTAFNSASGSLQGSNFQATLVNQQNQSEIKTVSPEALENNNIIKGEFDKDRGGDLITVDEADGKRVAQHYREIENEKLKNLVKTPSLKLGIENSDGSVVYEPVRVVSFDPKLGTVLFHLKTERNGVSELVQPFTGEYQIILP